MSFDVNKSLKLTIDSSKVDSDLTDFPVLVSLSSETGITGYDATAVFDELYIDLDDDFTGTNGTYPSSDKWTTTDTSSKMSIQNNRLEFDSQEATDTISYIDANWNLSGDFDIQVDVQELNGSNPSGSNHEIRLQIKNEDIGYSFIRMSRGSAGKTFNTTSLPTSSDTIARTIDDSKLRITRSGSTMKAYYWSGSQWEWDGNTNGKTFSGTSSNDITTIRLYFKQEADGSTRWNGFFDNFTVNSGSIVWPEGTNPNRKKIAITTTVSGIETQLPVEIESWDALNEKSTLWVKVPTLSSGVDTSLTLYYDSIMDDNSHRTAEEASDTFSGLYGTTPDPTKWLDMSDNGWIINNNRVSNYGDVWEILRSEYRLVGDFDIQVDIDTTAMPSDSGYYSRLYVRSQDYDTDQIFIGLKYDATYARCYSANYYNGGWGGQQYSSTSDIISTVRITRVGSIITTYFWNGSGWTNLLSHDFGYTPYMKIDFNHVCPSTLVTTYFSSFIVNSADSITGFIGDSGSYQASKVWDDNFVAVYHMAQDPSGGAGAIKDSTFNANHGTSNGDMTSDDLVQGFIGKAIDFDGVDDYIDCGTDSSLSLTDSFTIETLVSPKTINSNRLVGKGNSSSSYIRNYYIYITSEFHFVTETVGDVFQETVSNNSIVVDESYYLVGVHNQLTTSNLIYFNGVFDNSRTDISSVSTNTAPMQIGQLYTMTSDYANSKITEIRLSKINRSPVWIKSTYYSSWNELITFDLPLVISFSNPHPTQSGIAYGYRHLLQLTTTVSGDNPLYTYDNTFYDVNGAQIGSTVSGISSGLSATSTDYLMTPVASGYHWYVTTTSSGYSAISDLYYFDSMFLCEGYAEVDGTRTSGIPIRLYKREDGSFIGEDISFGVSGTFQIPTSYTGYHYAVAIHNSDIYRNAVIFDWLAPTTS